MHPDVLVVDVPFAGYRYWLAMTPYPGGDDTVENPAIRVSEDGLTWHPVPGAPDPVVPPPADVDYHNADPELVIDGHTLRMFYLTRSRTKPHAIISVISSTNGRDWSPPCVVIEQQWGVSPAVIRRSAGWSLYYVHADLQAGPAHYELRRRDGKTSLEFADEATCTLELPGHHLWHVDLLDGADGIEGLVAAFPHGTDPSRCRLFHVRSRDGVHFSVSDPAPLLEPSRLGWDNRMIYRSTFWKKSCSEYVILYSAASWGLRCGIGAMRGPLHQLRPVVHDDGKRGRALGLSRSDAAGLLKYVILRWVPRPVLALLRPQVLGLTRKAG